MKISPLSVTLPLVTCASVLLAACGGAGDTSSATSAATSSSLTAAIEVVSSAQTPATLHHLYVAPNGSDDNPGTEAQPFATIAKAAQAALPSTTVHVAPGTYGGGFKTASNGTETGRVYFVSDKKWAAKIVPGGGERYGWTVTGRHITVSGFDVDGSAGSNWTVGLLSEGTNVAFENNHVHDIATRAGDCNSTGGGGIVGDSHDGGNTVTVDSNLVHDIGPAYCKYIHGIYMSTNGKVSNNIVHRVGDGGIHLWHDADRIDIVNNTVFNTPKAIIVGTGGRYFLDRPGDNIRVANNILVDNDVAIMEQSDGKGYGQNNSYVNNLLFRNGLNANLYPENKAHVSGTITDDPLMVNYQASGSGDYHLRSDSPAIGKASADAPELDFDGKARVRTVGLDLGAYQH